MRTRKASGVVLAFVLLATGFRASAQIPFEQAVADLKSPDADTRFRAVELLKDAAYPEAALPLAGVISDHDPDVQIEAMSGKLNIFLAEKVTSRRRVGLVIERRNKVNAEASFAAGRSIAGARVVPLGVTTALRGAVHAASRQIALEALYTYGVLAPECSAADRPELLRASAPDLAAMLALPAIDTRVAALRVVGRVYARRPGDGPIDEMVGDAVIAALNDKNADVKAAAMQALGAMKYGRAVEGLTDLFAYYKRGSLAQSALEALSKIGSPVSAPVFLSELSAQEAPRVAAIEGLARIGDQSKTGDIDAATANARSGAVSLAGVFASACLSKGPIDQIVEDLSRPALHDQAFGYLTELAPGRVRQFAQGSQDPDPKIRADVADVLGMAGDPAAVPMLAAMEKDRDPQVARAAARATARLRSAR